MQNLEGFWW